VISVNSLTQQQAQAIIVGDRYLMLHRNEANPGGKNQS
jgi:hypothetical protein